MVFCEWIGCVKELHHPVCNALCPLVQDEDAIHVFLIVGTLFDLATKIIRHGREGGVQP